MKISCAILAASLTATSAFAPAATRSSSAMTSLSMSEETAETVADSLETPEVPAAPVVPAINGWVPDSSKPCYGLPGSSAPFGYFDPLGFCKVRRVYLVV